MQQKTNQNRVRINHQIRTPQVRLILVDGTSPGVVSTQDALQKALEANLDLVEINPKSIPPVCKILDYGKFKYEEKKKQANAKKSQKTTELKEITFRPNTGEHDLGHKLELAKQFLADGHKVKFTIKFRGREITHPEIGNQKIDWLLQQLSTVISSIPPVSMDGKIMSTIVAPK